VGDWKEARFGVEGLDWVFDASTAIEAVGDVFRRFAGDVNMLSCMQWKAKICLCNCSLNTSRAFTIDNSSQSCRAG
jgi:hypothetical protein